MIEILYMAKKVKMEEEDRYHDILSKWQQNRRKVYTFFCGMCLDKHNRTMLLFNVFSKTCF